jgi:predicted nucleic acid-binding protein
MVSLKGFKVYLDANTLIYALEGLPDFGNLQSGLLTPLEAKEFSVVTSQLTLLETIVFPKRHGDLVGEQKFRTFLTNSANVTVVPISETVIEYAADLRAKFPSLKTPDAIHLATGMLAGCALFVTADQGWSKTGVTVVDPSDIADR